MNKHTLEIKDSKERREMAGVLFNNGYTVKKSVVAKPNSKTKSTVLEYWKEEK